MSALRNVMDGFCLTLQNCWVGRAVIEIAGNKRCTFARAKNYNLSLINPVVQCRQLKGPLALRYGIFLPFGDTLAALKLIMVICPYYTYYE